VTIRVGFLGAGFIAGLHAFQLGRCDTDHAVVAVHDPDPERAASFADWKGAEVLDSPEAVVEASDAVFICTWTAAHPANLRAVLDAGRAVFLEKPLAVDLATAREMAADVTEAGVVNMVGLVLRSSPALLALRELIRDPAAGRLMNITFRDDQYIPIQGMYGSDWRGDRERAGAGALLEHSIHDLDILEWLAGPIETISAHTSFFHGLDGIEDSVSVLARFRDGHTATLTSVWHDILSRPSLRRMEAFSERSLATLEGDLVGPVRWQRQPAGSTDPEDTDEGVVDDATIEPWLAQRGIEPVIAEELFLRAVEAGGPSPGPTIEDAVRAHVVVDAVYRSAAEGGAPQHVAP